MPTAVRLVDVAPTPLAVVRCRARPIEPATMVPHTCGQVWDVVRGRHLKAGRHVAVYLNGNIDVEIGVEIMSTFEETGEIVRSHLPVGLAATAVRLGPYHCLGEAHHAIREWCAANRRLLTGINWEIYGHWESGWTNDQSRIRTDVFYQVAPT